MTAAVILIVAGCVGILAVCARSRDGAALSVWPEWRVLHGGER